MPQVSGPQVSGPQRIGVFGAERGALAGGAS